MARRRRSKKLGKGGIFAALLAGVAVLYNILTNYISEIIGVLVVSLLLIGIVAAIYAVIKSNKRKQREKLQSDILEYLNLRNIDSLLKPYDDQITVKSRQALDNYDDIKYLKESGRFEDVRKIARAKKIINKSISSFLKRMTLVKDHNTLMLQNN